MTTKIKLKKMWQVHQDPKVQKAYLLIVGTKSQQRFRATAGPFIVADETLCGLKYCLPYFLHLLGVNKPFGS